MIQLLNKNYQSSKSHSFCLTYIFTIFILFFLFLPVFAKAATLNKAPNNLGLLGYWNFNEGTGTTVKDLSGLGNTGTITGATWTAGKLGKALSFNGSSNYVNIANSITLNQSSFTAFAWFKTTATGDQKILSNNLSYHQLQIINGHLRICVNGCSEGSTAINDNNWHLAVVVGDATSIRAYLDGRSTAEITQAVSSNNMTGTFSVGKVGNGDTSYYFNGKIDEVRIYNRALSATEISALYKYGASNMNSSQSGKLTNGLVGLWSFDGKDVSGSTSYDRSGNGYNGTITGATPAIGRSGQAMNFKGLNSGTYVGVGNNVALNPANFTISAWAKPGDFSGSYGYIYSNARDCCGSYKGIEFRFAANKLNVQIWNTTVASLTSNATIANTSDWVFVTASYDGSNLKLYINGVQDNTTATALGIGTPASYNSAIGGMGMAPGTYTINGKLDEVRLYNRALSATEINQLYNMSSLKINSSQNKGGGTLNSGLVGMWSFNGADINWGTNTVYDRSGQGNNGNITNMSTTTSPVAGKLGQALRFDGNNYIDVGNKSSLNTTDLTVSTWLKPISGAVGIVGKWGTTPYYYVMMSGNDVCIRLSNTTWNTYCTASSVIPFNEWSHLIITVNSSTLVMKVYINNVLKSTFSFDAGQAGQYTNANSFNIGNIGNALGGYNFKGIMDEVRIYNRALSADEIKQLYLMGR